jgi:hypothetical protein
MVWAGWGVSPPADPSTSRTRPPYPPLFPRLPLQLVSSGGSDPRPLRDIVLPDLSVASARFVDQRANGGLTALHLAVVSGDLDGVQVLLRSGAAILVKSGDRGPACVGGGGAGHG